MDRIINNSIEEHKKALQLLEESCKKIKEIASLFARTIENNGKIIFFGNGGSAADAQHLAAEFVGRFKKDRKSLAAISLTTNTSIITAVGNDHGFNDIFVRQIEAIATKDDVAVGISTSGKSDNVKKALEKASALGLKTVGFLGKDGGDLKDIVDIDITIPSFDTPRIQEIHILAGHIICEIVEEELT